MRIRQRSAVPRVEINMTPMIDVVFQLLAFFIVSFQIVKQEGDLAIKMPLDNRPGVPDIAFDLPLQVHLRAGAAGELARIDLSGRSMADTNALRSEVEQIAALSPDNVDKLSVDLVCDPKLHYVHVMAALTAVSGKREGNRVMPLASNVRLVRAE